MPGWQGFLQERWAQVDLAWAWNPRGTALPCVTASSEHSWPAGYGTSAFGRIGRAVCIRCLGLCSLLFVLDPHPPADPTGQRLTMAALSEKALGGLGSGSNWKRSSGPYSSFPPSPIPSTSLINCLPQTYRTQAFWGPSMSTLQFSPPSPAPPLPPACHHLVSPAPSRSGLWARPLCPWSACLPSLHHRGTGPWPHGGSYSLGLVRLPSLASRLSCSQVVRLLSPSVVFLFPACVCTECHEFDLVIA